MSQEEVLAMIRTFGPIRSYDLKRSMRQGASSIHRALAVLQRTGEIAALNPETGACGAGRARWWVAV